MKVSVGQFNPSADVAGNLATMRRLSAAAAQEGSKLILFPEEAMFSVGKVVGEASNVKGGLAPMAVGADHDEGGIFAVSGDEQGDIHAQLRTRFDQVLLEAALEHTGGHRQRAALALGLGRKTLTRKLGPVRPRKRP